MGSFITLSDVLVSACSVLCNARGKNKYDNKWILKLLSCVLMQQNIFFRLVDKADWNLAQATKTSLMLVFSVMIL